MRRILTLAACLWLVLGHSADAADKKTPSVQALFRRAGHIVRSRVLFTGASSLEADGTPSAGSATTASEVDRWRFVFDNQRTRGSRFRSVVIKYGKGGFGSVTGRKPAFLEDNRIRPLPKMTLDDAISLLRAAGYQQPFASVTLRFPLGPPFSEPLYVFGFDTGTAPPFVGVGTKTGTVTPLS
jgi:hypothetical protein